MPKKKFSYTKCAYRVISEFINNTWQPIEVSDSEYLTLHEGSTVLHYGQGCFEGLKAYKFSEKQLSIFRPIENFKRLNMSCERLLIPQIPETLFMTALEKLVTLNKDAFSTDQCASLYIRPFIIGVGEHLGVSPSNEYHFRLFCCPVTDNYYANAVTLAITDSHRCPSQGIGHAKAIGNYASGLKITRDLKSHNVDDVLYLDSEHNTYIEETNTSNIIFIKSNCLYIPQSPSILQSITVKSIAKIASDLGLSVEKKRISYKELVDFEEAAICGTAVTLIPVKHIVDKTCKPIASYEAHATVLKLKQILNDIQEGRCDDHYNWNKVISI